MIKSMTGFATAELIDGDISVTVDIRAYNSRHLDIVLRVPSNYQALEEKMKGLVTRQILRGRLDAKVQIKDGAEETVAFEIDWARAKAMHAALIQLKNNLDLLNDISVDHLLSVGGVVKPVETAEEAERMWPAVQDCFNRALDDLEAMRKKEGAFIADDLTARLNCIEDCLGEIKADSDNLIGQYQERLKERITALTQETVELDPARLAQEAAYLADRSDISEEIVRVQSHLKQFRHIMESEAPGGPKA